MLSILIYGGSELIRQTKLANEGPSDGVLSRSSIAMQWFPKSYEEVQYFCGHQTLA